MEKKRVAYITLQVVLLVLLCITYAASITFDYIGPALIAISLGKPNASILNRPPSISSKYYVEANVREWGHSTMWRLSYALMGISILFICISSCLPLRFNIVYRKPTLISIPFLVLFNVNYATNIIWVVVTNFEVVWLMSVLVVFLTCSLYAALAFAYKDLWDDIETLEKSNKIILWGTRVLVHNLIAIYPTWLSIIWPLNLALSLSYVNSFDHPTAILTRGLTVSEASTLGLVIILMELLIWFTFENLLIERYCRYTLTVYPVVIFAMCSIITNVSSIGGINLVLACLLLAVSAILFCIRISLVVLVSWKSYRRGSEVAK